MREIGSEFWKEYGTTDTENTDKKVYLLSGRTALRFIIEDIRRNKSAEKVLMPSYCCESMIEPFVSLGIEVEFYQVSSEGIDYPYDNDADIVFLIDFFGYENAENVAVAKCEKQAGKIIIYDATHKLDGNKKVQENADYSFCSYRKWFYCNYAEAVNHNGTFEEKKFLTNKEYIALRNEAADAKKKYMEGSAIDKEIFLKKFGVAEEKLDKDYAGYAGEKVDFDSERIISSRRKNAAYLIEELKKIPQIKLWREKVDKNDTPLFVPVLVEESVRNDLRRKLIDEKIYCPVHWPLSEYHTKTGKLYDMELSLVCDQRYDISDMQRMVKVIKDYFSR